MRGRSAMVFVAAPLVALSLGSAVVRAEPRVFRVGDYGAAPGTDADSGDAIRSAIQAAMASGPGAEVVLEAGVYRVGPAADGGYCFPIHQANGLTVRGAGLQTRIVITSPSSGGFSVGLGRNVVLRDFTIDYDPVPFCQGVVRAVDVEGGTFDLEVEEGYSTPDAANFMGAAEPYGKWGMVIDPATRRIRAGTPDHYMTPRWEHREGRVFRFFTPEEHYRRNLVHVRPGDSYVHLARGYGSAVIAQGCTDVRLENIRVYASPGLAVGLVANSGGVVVRKLEIRFAPDTTRLLTTNADGVHCQQNRAGPVIEDCYFEGMADDAVNIYAPPNILLEVRSASEWLVSAGCLVLPGERLQVFDPQTGRVRGEVIATAVKPENGKLLLTLGEPLEGVVAGADHRTADTLYNLSACGAGFVIRNNTMNGNRRYGCMLRAGGGLVEGNVFEDTTGAGVAILNEPDWPEGPIPWGITVRGNRFIRGGTCLGYADSPQGASLSVRAVRLGFALAADRPVHDIIIEGNEFVDSLGAAVFAGACSSLIVRGNRVRASAEAPLLHNTAAIVIADSAGVELVGNEVDDPRPGVTAAVSVMADVEPGEDGVRITDLVTSLAPESKAVDDGRTQ